jgi:hypothetical protein
MHKAELLLQRFLAIDFREETDTVDIPFVRYIHTAYIRDSREDIGKVGDSVACLSRKLVSPCDD